MNDGKLWNTSLKISQLTSQNKRIAELKMLQHADDSTNTLKGLDSVKNVVELINNK